LNKIFIEIHLYSNKNFFSSRTRRRRKKSSSAKLSIEENNELLVQLSKEREKAVLDF
jgi:hypothetical protein